MCLAFLALMLLLLHFSINARPMYPVAHSLFPDVLQGDQCTRRAIGMTKCRCLSRVYRARSPWHGRWRRILNYGPKASSFITLLIVHPPLDTHVAAGIPHLWLLPLRAAGGPLLVLHLQYLLMQLSWWTNRTGYRDGASATWFVLPLGTWYRRSIWAFFYVQNQRDFDIL